MDAQEVPVMGHPPPSDSTFSTVQEVNTALTVIVGSAQLIERKIVRGKPLSPDELLAVLATIQRQGRQAAQALAQLLPAGDDEV
jgi:hypothetical protein